MAKLIPGKKYIYSQYTLFGKLKSRTVVTYVGSDRDNEMFRTKSFKEVLVPFKKVSQCIELYDINRYNKHKEDNTDGLH